MQGDATDAVPQFAFGVKESLVKAFEHHDAGTDTPDGRDIGGGEWWEMHYDFVLAPEDGR